MVISVHSSKHDSIYGIPCYDDGILADAKVIEDLTTADGKEHKAHVEKDVNNTLRAKNDGAEHASERIGPHILVEKL